MYVEFEVIFVVDVSWSLSRDNMGWGWDRLQSTFSGEEATCTKEPKHRLIKNGCMCCSKGSVAKISE